LLPESAIPFRIVDGRVLPGFLDARDVPWLRVLMDEVDRFCGMPVRELLERLRAPLPCAAPVFKLRAARSVLLRLWKSELRAEVAPERAREAVFVAASAGGSRREALEAAARSLHVDPTAAERLLFADLPGEKLVSAPAKVPSPEDLALRINSFIARSLLFHARGVRIQAEGTIRPLVRQAKLHGLLCSVSHSDRDERHPALDLSGPFTVFRHTLLYGRALGELLQFLPHVAHYRLRAECVLREQEAVLELASGAPIFPCEPPRRFDSKLEARFAKDFAKAAPDWDLVREPEPIPAAGTLIFPDFRIHHRLRPELSFLIEIAGFWSPDYLRRKLALLRAAGRSDLILCIDEDRACGDDELPPAAKIVRFRRRLDPQAVLQAAGCPTAAKPSGASSRSGSQPSGAR
jgi:predicted nuclease of restriction endonuclease-like RecB superfamily